MGVLVLDIGGDLSFGCFVFADFWGYVEPGVVGEWWVFCIVLDVSVFCLSAKLCILSQK